MAFTALTPMPRSSDLAAAPALHTDTLDFHFHSGSADANQASLRRGSPARTVAAWQAASDAAAIGQAPCR